MTAVPEHADVVVVGGGLAGVCAALEAADHGAEVLLLEKQADLGGSTVLSGGFFAFAGTSAQQRQALRDSPGLLHDDLVALGGPYADKELISRYVEVQGELYDWLDGGGTFTSVQLGAGQSVARGHSGDIGALFTRLAGKARSRPSVSVHSGTPVRRLLREPQGRVHGVLVDIDGTPRPLAAGAGVVVTAGGFSRSEALLQTFAPDQADALRIGGRGNTGDGLRMAWACGADMRDMGQVKGTFGTHPSATTEAHELLLAFYLGAIVVNRAGHRFVDESLSYKLLGDACLAQPGAGCLQVFDQAVMDRSAPGVPLYDLAQAQRRGLITTADTWPELAEATGLDADTLVSTVERYNRDARTGVDSAFGRRGLSHGAGEMAALTEPPFHAFASTTAVLATYCGLRITPDAQVVDVFDTPIDGLYAAGEVTGGFHGRAYMTGSSLGKAAAFGRIAGAHAAAPRHVDRTGGRP